MNQINFLPLSYQKERARKRRRPIEVMVIALTGLALVALWQVAGGPDRTLASQSESIDRDIKRIEQMQAEESELQLKRSQLEQRLMIARETYQPITVTQVLARLSDRAPTAVRFIDLELKAERPAPEYKPKPGGQPTKRVVGQPSKPAPMSPHCMRIEIIGHAPSDDEVVTLIRQLGSDPIFTSVALRGSRVKKTKTHFVREFRLDLVIDLDRRFVPTADEGEAR